MDTLSENINFKHKSVLLDETIEMLNIKPNGIYVDGTLGGAGHSYEICKGLGDKGRLIGIDQDEAAILAGSNRLKEFGDKVTIVRSNYSNMKTVLLDLGIQKVDGILLDLGVSSYQLDTPERGFSYKENAPLDMRMDTRNEITAKDIVNNYSEHDLYRIIRDYGEDKFAKNIAKHIVRVRGERPIETTDELTEAIKAAIPMKIRMNTGHPAKKTFQAIRIELNKELEVLSKSLDDMIEMLNDKGRLCIITFHSLEDRIVKSSFRKNEDPCTCPPNFPVCVCGNRSQGTVITRKPIAPSEEEVLNNKRSKSSKLRVFEKKVENNLK
ncbi:16S rRNA (cytosine(1402)-N(4))-methyltransferase RsmH [Anaerocolumna aminovalerica]|uniref:Ribosomal RNA small subunit methyltransferase H n=1 Tax=Anaerocolumna aminovalerica TaxID=1527 RepID=A0A1I5FBF9_9FIRM|nr:16S rRNA (cytosine(1402)-N(4))-methyltransferase RsmH [Anaerocolumna aminovalerica]SFO21084.1 16S rRNA (cytosine1402-N4)-methyltransferase [Anaerocolumna aminovalerica]